MRSLFHSLCIKLKQWILHGWKIAINSIHRPATASSTLQRALKLHLVLDSCSRRVTPFCPDANVIPSRCSGMSVIFREVRHMIAEAPSSYSDMAKSFVFIHPHLFRVREVRWIMPELCWFHFTNFRRRAQPFSVRPSIRRSTSNDV
jgi:hypothetical protein